MVVGAQVDVFLGVLLHHVDDVDGADAVVELCGDVVKAFALVGDVFQRVFRRVDRARGRRRHRPDRHIGADLALQLVERARVVGAGAAAEGLHAAPVAVPVDHQQVVDPLQRAVFLRRVVALVGLVRSADGLRELRKDLAAGNALIRVRRRRGRRRGFGFFARILVVLRSGADRGEQAHAEGRFDLVAHVFEAVVIRHRVVVKRRDAGGEIAGKIALERERGELREVAVLDLRLGGARKDEQENGDGRENEQKGADRDQGEPGLKKRTAVLCAGLAQGGGALRLIRGGVGHDGGLLSVRTGSRGIRCLWNPQAGCSRR